MLAVFVAVVLSGGEMRINGRLITDPSPWHHALFLGIPVLFTLPGLAMLRVRRRIILSSRSLVTELRTIPGLGWTTRLEVSGPVTAFLAHRGAKMNGRPVDAVVVSSGGREASFGSFMSEDLKAYLVAVIADHYGTSEEAASPFIPGPDAGR